LPRKWMVLLNYLINSSFLVNSKRFYFNDFNLFISLFWQFRMTLFQAFQWLYLPKNM
jgi:hypothetical protein